MFQVSWLKHSLEDSGGSLPCRAPEKQVIRETFRSKEAGPKAERLIGTPSPGPAPQQGAKGAPGREQGLGEGCGWTSGLWS